MATRVLILAPAERDIAEAFSWYEKQQPGLGYDFVRAVDARVCSVQRVPEQAGYLSHPYRSAIVRRFPYMVLYTYHGDTVTIYAVFHTSQNPEKWRDRI